jgi:hypothetical protein
MISNQRKSGQRRNINSSRKNLRNRSLQTQLAQQDSKALSVSTTLACDGTGAVFLLNGIAPGYAIDQRLGRTIILDSISFRILDQVTPTTGLDQYHRILLVEDHQPNGAAPALTDILDSNSTVSMPNLANRARFRIIYDLLDKLNASTEPDSNKSFVVPRLPLNLRVVFNAGTAGTVADIVTNSLYLLVVGSLNAGVTAGFTTISSRIKFHNSI